MRKIIATLCCFLAMLMYFLPMFASAHSGKTDGSGGHFNRSTGEYHYHHGYSAHDHWDIDGDGITDCPYNYDDKTNHNSNNSGTDTNNQTETNPRDNTTQQNKEYNRIYAYITIGFIVVFFVLVNCLAIHIDKTDKSQRDEPISLPSVFISVLSTVIVFALLFYIVYLFKQPLMLRAISFEEMLQVLFFSALLGSIVWIAANWASSLVNTLLCTLFKVEVHGWAGSFQRLTIPLSYAFTVLLFILQ